MPPLVPPASDPLRENITRDAVAKGPDYLDIIGPITLIDKTEGFVSRMFLFMPNVTKGMNETFGMDTTFTVPYAPGIVLGNITVRVERGAFVGREGGRRGAGDAGQGEGGASGAGGWRVGLGAEGRRGGGGVVGCWWVGGWAVRWGPLALRGRWHWAWCSGVGPPLATPAATTPISPAPSTHTPCLNRLPLLPPPTPFFPPPPTFFPPHPPFFPPHPPYPGPHGSRLPANVHHQLNHRQDHLQRAVRNVRGALWHSNGGCIQMGDCGDAAGVRPSPPSPPSSPRLRCIPAAAHLQSVWGSQFVQAISTQACTAIKEQCPFVPEAPGVPELPS